MVGTDVEIKGAAVYLRPLTPISVDSAFPPPMLAAIVTADGNHPIGNITIGLVSLAHRIADVRVIARDSGFWEKPIAAEAVRLATSYAFSYLRLRRLTLSLDSSNVEAIRAFESAGFRIEGRRRRQIGRNGTQIVQTLMGLAGLDGNGAARCQRAAA